ncbi:probable G-protein coupled receptor CG31760 [Xenia sp. Carnegie-2017]|uniref:probable G-protein coupled receptor CG31760 n=1 Tax=Xenia sp. Carnegie-2017 TaxID=2897299 RepID=UPI001F04FE21|nr:probable G-protein coupled receptor CG31760 [Xenia sp. Carnegie-2017]
MVKLVIIPMYFLTLWRLNFVSLSSFLGEVLFLLWGVWLCIRVRNAPSAYNESKYIAWCIYNTLFVKIVVGLLRIVLDNFHNPDVAYVVNSLSTHVIATVMLVLLFAFKVYFLKKYNVNQRRRSRGSSSIATTMTDLRKSPFHLNRLEDGTLVCENDEEKSREGLETENIQLREEIRDLTAKLAACEYKQQREQRRQQGSPQENSYISTSSETRHSRFNSETESAQG